MYFKSTTRRNPKTGNLTGYYRLVESYRNENGRVCHRTILTVGFMEGVTSEQRLKIQNHLTDRYDLVQQIFEEEDAVVKEYVESLWQQMIDKKRVDRASNRFTTTR